MCSRARGEGEEGRGEMGEGKGRGVKGGKGNGEWRGGGSGSGRGVGDGRGERREHKVINCSPIALHAMCCLINPIRSGGGGALKAPLQSFVLMLLILELQYCALGTFPKKV